MARKERSSVWFNAVLRGDGDSITVGADSNIQDLALCHVDPGVILWLRPVMYVCQPAGAQPV
jgi:carbonic anhydrase/acetyltransferase-like protein (isoleucine patch superfamily)